MVVILGYFMRIDTINPEVGEARRGIFPKETFFFEKDYGNEFDV